MKMQIPTYYNDRLGNSNLHTHADYPYEGCVSQSIKADLRPLPQARSLLPCNTLFNVDPLTDRLVSMS